MDHLGNATGDVGRVRCRRTLDARDAASWRGSHLPHLSRPRAGGDALTVCYVIAYLSGADRDRTGDLLLAKHMA
jgi:hypothetical protein